MWSESLGGDGSGVVVVVVVTPIKQVLHLSPSLFSSPYQRDPHGYRSLTPHTALTPALSLPPLSPATPARMKQAMMRGRALITAWALTSGLTLILMLVKAG